MKERAIQRKEEYKNAILRLKEALNEKNITEVVIDGILHRFEFTFELAWKTLKDYLEYIGVINKTGSPRETIKNAFQAGIIEDGEEWIDMMLARNLLAHLYSEGESRKIYYDIKEKYIFLFEKLLEKI